MEEGNKSSAHPKWPVYESDEQKYVALESGNGKTLDGGLRTRKCFFWHSYLPSLNRALGKPSTNQVINVLAQ